MGIQALCSISGLLAGSRRQLQGSMLGTRRRKSACGNCLAVERCSVDEIRAPRATARTDKAKQHTTTSESRGGNRAPRFAAEPVASVTGGSADRWATAGSEPQGPARSLQGDRGTTENQRRATGVMPPPMRDSRPDGFRACPGAEEARAGSSLLTGGDRKPDWHLAWRWAAGHEGR